MKQFTFTQKESKSHPLSYQPTKQTTQQANNQTGVTLDKMSESQETNGVDESTVEVCFL